MPADRVSYMYERIYCKQKKVRHLYKSKNKKQNFFLAGAMKKRLTNIEQKIFKYKEKKNEKLSNFSRVACILAHWTHAIARKLCWPQKKTKKKN